MPRLDPTETLLRLAILVSAAFASAALWWPHEARAARLKEVAEWTERFRVIWEQRFDRLERYLQELKAKEKRHGRQQRRKQ